MCAYFLDPTDPLLKNRALEVPLHEIPLPAIQTTIDQMYEFAQTERVAPSKRSLVGMAAPQIGIGKRIILVDIQIDSERKFFGELKIFINPQILTYSKEQLLDREGCFSVDSRIFGIVPRFESIHLIAYDRYGNPITDTITGFTARIIQHEIDLLDGIFFPDRVGEDGRLHWVESHEFDHYRMHWQNWPNTCPWHRWLEIKEGKQK